MATFSNPACDGYAAGDVHPSPQTKVQTEADLPRTNEDPLAPARGLMLGALISGFLWIGIIAAIREVWILWR
jgi:hypothetical protein